MIDLTQVVDHIVADYDLAQIQKYCRVSTFIGYKLAQARILANQPINADNHKIIVLLYSAIQKDIDALDQLAVSSDVLNAQIINFNDVVKLEKANYFQKLYQIANNHSLDHMSQPANSQEIAELAIINGNYIKGHKRVEGLMSEGKLTYKPAARNVSSKRSSRLAATNNENPEQFQVFYYIAEQSFRDVSPASPHYQEAQIGIKKLRSNNSFTIPEGKQYGYQSQKSTYSSILSDNRSKVMIEVKNDLIDYLRVLNLESKKYQHMAAAIKNLSSPDQLYTLIMLCLRSASINPNQAIVLLEKLNGITTLDPMLKTKMTYHLAILHKQLFEDRKNEFEGDEHLEKVAHYIELTKLLHPISRKSNTQGSLILDGDIVLQELGKENIKQERENYLKLYETLPAVNELIARRHHDISFYAFLARIKAASVREVGWFVGSIVGTVSAPVGFVISRLFYRYEYKNITTNVPAQPDKLDKESYKIMNDYIYTVSQVHLAEEQNAFVSSGSVKAANQSSRLFKHAVADQSRSHSSHSSRSRK